MGDEANNLKLLSMLDGVDFSLEVPNLFVHLLSFANGPSPVVCIARWRSVILEEPRGDGGFGYDPLFYLLTIVLAPNYQRIKKSAQPSWASIKFITIPNERFKQSVIK